MREENDKKQDEEEVDANAEVVAPKPELSPQELGKKLALAERILYGRVVVGAILFCIFAALDVSAVLTGKMQEQGGNFRIQCTHYCCFWSSSAALVRFFGNLSSCSAVILVYQITKCDVER